MRIADVDKLLHEVKINANDIFNNPVDDSVTHWMPLPELPEGE